MLKYSQAIDVQFIGVWDTVGALGLPFGNLPLFGRSDMQFLNTGLRASNKFAFHALAIDEHRKAFTPTLWTVDRSTAPNHTNSPPRPLDEVEQRWFVGAHANVGGGYQSDLLAQLPLEWMMQKAIAHGLSFRRTVDLDGNPETSPVCDSYAEFMDGWYRVVTFNHPYYREIGQDAARSGPQTVRSTINETIDASVFDRWRSVPSYRPPNLIRWAQKYQADPGTLRGAVRADHPATAVD